jgi:flagellar biosynthetic protein FliQ
MTRDQVVSLTVDAMSLSMKIGGPLLLAGLLVGLIVSIFQAVTQIQEQTLTFIPKIVATAAVMIIGGPWMLDQLIVYMQDLYLSIPQLSGP